LGGAVFKDHSSVLQRASRINSCEIDYENEKNTMRFFTDYQEALAYADNNSKPNKAFYVAKIWTQ